MKYAIVNGVRKEATKSGERGKCIFCESEMIANCGEWKINHWKHFRRDCDNWKETETEWHLSWKNQFPKNYQEVIMKDKRTGEKHIADVHNKFTGITIEFQHSPISNIEIESREEFYDELVWVVDLEPFAKNIVLHSYIDYYFFEINVMKWARKSDRLRAKYIDNGDNENLEELNSIDEENYKYQEYFENKYKDFQKPNHFLLEWKYQKSRWMKHNSELYFDLGDDRMYRNVETVKLGGGFVVEECTKQDFINKYNPISYVLEH